MAGFKKKVESADTVCVALNYARDIDFPMANGKTIHLNGNATGLRGKEIGVLPVGAFGLTVISKDEWEALQKEWGTMKIFQNGLCFSAGNTQDTQEEAEDRKETRNGLEPVDTKKTRTKEYKGN